MGTPSPLWTLTIPADAETVSALLKDFLDDKCQDWRADIGADEQLRAPCIPGVYEVRGLIVLGGASDDGSAVWRLWSSPPADTSIDIYARCYRSGGAAHGWLSTYQKVPCTQKRPCAGQKCKPLSATYLVVGALRFRRLDTVRWQVKVLAADPGGYLWGPGAELMGRVVSHLQALYSRLQPPPPVGEVAEATEKLGLSREGVSTRLLLEGVPVADVIDELENLLIPPVEVPPASVEAPTRWFLRFLTGGVLPRDWSPDLPRMVWKPSGRGRVTTIAGVASRIAATGAEGRPVDLLAVFVDPRGDGTEVTLTPLLTEPAAARGLAGLPEELCQAVKMLPDTVVSAFESRWPGRVRRLGATPAPEQPEPPVGQVAETTTPAPGGDATSEGPGSRPWEAIPKGWQREAVRLWWETGMTKPQIFKQLGRGSREPKTAENVFYELRKLYGPEVVPLDKDRPYRRKRG